MARSIVLVSGKDPIEEIGVGHTTYARAHARAALQAGFTPHIFCVSRHAGIVATDFGVVHRIRSPWPLRPTRGVGFRYVLVWLHAPLIAASVKRFLLACDGPHLLHGIGIWGWVGVDVSEHLRREDGSVIPVVSAYSTYAHEREAQARGLKAAHGPLRRIHFRAEHLWSRLVVDRYERRMHMGSRLVIVNYDSVRQLLVATYGIGAKCRKLPYTSESAFLRRGIQDTPAVPNGVSGRQHRKTPLIVAVSRHDPLKGVDILLEALARLRAAGETFHACLIGAGFLLEAHRRLADRLGLSDMVSMEGLVADPYSYLQCADVFVLPSLEEGSGSLSLLEALQAGVAVIASNIDGIPEDVVDGESAVLVEPGDSSALAGALKRVLSDAGLRRGLAQRGRASFEARFAPDAFADALRRTYAEFGVTP